VNETLISFGSNVQSVVAQRYMKGISANIATSLQRLSSGYRINGAADDPAGLGQSEQLRAQIRGLAVGSSNALAGHNLVQTADSAMGETSLALQRMRELAVQASSDGNLTSADRENINIEYQSLLTEVSRIATSTTYNSTDLLDGTFTGKTIQVGADSGAAFQIAIGLNNVNISAAGLNISGGTVSTVAKATTAITALDAAIVTLGTARARAGAEMAQLQSASDHAAGMRVNLVAQESRIRDVDVAKETSILVRNQVLLQANIAMQAHANALPKLLLKLL